MTINTEGLPPEMQARIAQIIDQAKSNVADPRAGAPVSPPVPAAPPAPKPPTLMDHVIMLRQEVDAMRQQLEAVGQVTDAVGQAVGQMYAMFQSQTEPSSYSSNFQAANPQQTQQDDY